jgi:hypothetical protein
VVCITSDSRSSSLAWAYVVRKGKEAVMDPTDINTRRFKRIGLTSNAIFRLWKAALKDDEKLLDEAIGSVYEQMMSSDPARAERVMSLIIRRHCRARDAFRAILQTQRALYHPRLAAPAITLMGVSPGHSATNPLLARAFYAPSKKR